MSDRDPSRGDPRAGPATAPSKPWAGRFERPVDPRLERFSSSVHFDRALWRQDVRGSIAHARMLARQGIIGAPEAEAIEKGLRQIASELESGEFEPDPALEDIHMNVERRLAEIAGPVAGRLHTGRSRNDQVATDLALWLRGAVVDVREALLELRSALVERADREVDVVLPGYTHLQRAQPIRLAHHWLAHGQALARDDGRLADARARLRQSPLGAGALAGSTLPLDRGSTARELGFESPNPNSLDAVAARDGVLEVLSALAILMVHLSRMAEEIVLWSSAEFGFIELDDSFATGSSLMPQKKNPDAAELVRGKTGRVIGDLVGLLVTLKGLPLAYNRDLQEDKEPLFDSVETALGSLAVLAGTITSLRVRPQAMAAAAADPMLLATDLAERLVGDGVPFREAHEAIGRLVGRALAEGVGLDGLSREILRQAHPSLDVEPGELFSVERSLEARGATGGPAREAVRAQLDQARDALATTARELEELRA
ncbi:MAG: argininosuccinate lyase [Myxococcota bacterium]